MDSRAETGEVSRSRTQAVSCAILRLASAATSSCRSRIPQHARLARALLFVFLAVLVVGAASAAELRSFGVEVPTSPGTIHWVDERKVVFMGLVPTNDDRFARHPGRRGGKLAQLDVDSGRIEWGDRFIGALCVDGDRIAYLASDESLPLSRQDERFWLLEGTIGNVKQREVTRDYIAATPFDFTYSCRPGAPLPPHGPEFPAMKRLRLEHGVAEYALTRTPLAEFPIRLFRAGRYSEPVTLGALQGKDVKRDWPFLRFKGAYWLVTNPRGYPITSPGRFESWWLYPDGRIEPAHDFDLNSTFDGWTSWIPVIPYRDGFLTTEGRTRHTPLLGNLGKAGLYRFHLSGKHQKLVTGEIGPWAVSPSGCRLAFGVDERRNNDPFTRMTLKVLQLCRTE